jgi:hypothetical protein
MRAADHARTKLAGFHAAGVDRLDLAVCNPEGLMLWQRNRPLEDLPWLNVLACRMAPASPTATFWIGPGRFPTGKPAPARS